MDFFIHWERFAYDKRGARIYSQTAAQAENNEVSFCLYDNLFRECIIGQFNGSLPELDGTEVVALPAAATGHETVYGYAISNFNLPTDTKYLTVNHYDNYGFLGANGFPVSGDSRVVKESQPLAGSYGSESSCTAMGLLTGTLNAVLDNSSADKTLWTVNYYDDRARVIQQRSNSHLDNRYETSSTCYDFTYDAIGRLVGASSSGNAAGHSETYAYDRQYNMTSATRNGVTTQFGYSGNQQTSIGSYTCTYDSDGRQITNGSINLIGTTYNEIGLPKERTYSTNNPLPNIYATAYSSDGTKLSATTIKNRVVSEKNYVGNLVLDGTFLDKTLIEGGYIDAQNRYHFLLTDHLGNVRADALANGTVVSTYDYYPYGDTFASTSPTAGQPYRFSGNEIDPFGTYDFIARQYAPSTGRFTTIDPLAEKYYSISPYSYCAGNPVNLVDPEGEGFFETIWFAIRYPSVALKIGSVNFNNDSRNISTSVARFALNFPKIDNKQDEGSIRGAFRHTLWQATITAEYGKYIAKEVGNAHETSVHISAEQSYDSLSEVDRNVDLLNNIVGRNLGGNNRGASIKDLAFAVLEEFKENGLYTATINDNGEWVITKTKISEQEYEKYKKIFENLDNNGF